MEVFFTTAGRAKEKNMDGSSTITQWGHKHFFRASPAQTSGTWKDLYRLFYARTQNGIASRGFPSNSFFSFHPSTF